MPRLLIAASGTGGHLYPALVIAESLPVDWDVFWLGVPDRLETRLIPKKFKLKTIRVGGIQSRGIRKLLDLARLFASTASVFKILREQKIQIIFTTGGYISAPAILAAKLLRIPVILHESNAIPGRVTRLLGRFCKLVALGLPVSSNHLNGCRLLVSGTPVRSSFSEKQALPKWVPSGVGPLIVVIGGSQGAKGLNHMIREIAPQFLNRGCRIVHLTGQNDESLPKLDHLNFAEKIFSDEIPSLFQHADLVISRAGAGALSELAICQTPAILVPFPRAKDLHQDANALCAAEVGGALIVHEGKFSKIALEKSLDRLLKPSLISGHLFNPLLKRMGENMQKLALKNSKEILVDQLLRLVK